MLLTLGMFARQLFGSVLGSEVLLSLTSLPNSSLCAPVCLPANPTRHTPVTICPQAQRDRGILPATGTIWTEQAHTLSAFIWRIHQWRVGKLIKPTSKQKERLRNAAMAGSKTYNRSPLLHNINERSLSQTWQICLQNKRKMPSNAQKTLLMSYGLRMTR